MHRHTLVSTFLLALACVLACGKGDETAGSTKPADPAAAPPGDPSAATPTPAPAAPVTPTAPATSPPPAGIDRLDFSAASLPAGVKTDGSVVGGMRWRDKAGENLLVFQKEVRPAKISAAKSPDGTAGTGEVANLYADHYVVGAGAARLVRRVQEKPEPCFDPLVDFQVSSYDLTDVDGDGVAEVTFAYAADCLHELMPFALKLMMLEGGDKYAVRGRAKVHDQGGSDSAPMVGGERTFDEAFDKAPAPFRAHATERFDRAAQTYWPEFEAARDAAKKAGKKGG